MEHRRSFEFHHDRTVWLFACTFNSHDAHIWSRFRFPFFDDLAFGIDRVAMKDGMRMDHLVVSKVCYNCTFGQVRDGQTNHESECKYAVDQALPKLCPGGKILIEVQRLGVHGQGGEE